MKKRIKKMLFGFFEKEITNYLGLNTKYVETKIIYEKANVIELKKNIVLGNRLYKNQNERYISDVIYKAKTDLFEAALPYIKLDSNKLFDQYNFPETHIELSLFVIK